MSSPSSDLPRLGSLTQSAREKKFRQARIILIVIAGLFVLQAVLEGVTLRTQIQGAMDQELRKMGLRRDQVDPVLLKQAEEQAMGIGNLIVAGIAGLAVVFVIFAILVYKFPVPITILGLIIYVGWLIIMAVVVPESIAKGWLIKIVVIVGLVSAIKAAIAYKQEEDRSRRAAYLEPEYE